MSNTKIKSSQFHGVVGHGTDGYFLMTNADGSMSWSQASTGPSVTSVAYPGDDTAADPAGGQTVVLTGTGFAASGMTVTIGGTTAPSVAHDSNTQLTITTPAKAAGDYDIVVTNGVTGASGTFVNGISYNGVPAWTTAAGSLGTFESETTISTITLQAAEPDGGTITFNITNGALPTGLSLTGANIDGTTTAESSTTLYSFTIEAIDDENQATPRNFSITVNSAELVSSENFTINTYTGNGSTQAIEGKIGTAAAFNGSSSGIFLSSTGSSILDYDQDFSISMWVYMTNLPHAVSQDHLWTGGGTRIIPMSITTSGYVFVDFFNGSSNSLTSTTSLSLNGWTHVVLTRSKTNGLIFYINGSSAGTSSFTGNAGSLSQRDTIGQYWDGTRNSFDGRIDQVRIFNTALNPTQVGELALETYADPKKSTTDYFGNGSGVALYELDEDANDTGGSFGSLVSSPEMDLDVDGYTSGSVADLSGNGNTGTVTGATYGTDPNGGGYFDFDGSDDDISVAHNADFNSSTNISFEVWVNRDSTTEDTILSKGTTVSNNYFFVYSPSNGYYYYNYVSGGGVKSGTTGLSTGQWEHVVVTRDGSGTPKIYVNGEDKSTTVGSPTSSSTTDTGALNIGGRNGFTATGYGFFDGKIGDVRFYTKQLSASEVVQNFNASKGSYGVGYDGTPTNVNFLGMAFAPDFVWIKTRGVGSHQLTDSVRGVTKNLFPDQTLAEFTETNTIQSFDLNGFSLGSEARSNGSGTNYVAWCWKAGGTAVSNTDGSITSTVSANQDAGFSIVKYTGSGANATVGHGLSSAPEMVIVKGLSTTYDWVVYHKDMTNATYYMTLNKTDSEASAAAVWNSTAPSSTSISLGSNLAVNSSGVSHIAYCFHSVAGYQKVGSYTGTGAAGNFVSTSVDGDAGFQPRWVMVKISSSSLAGWVIVDSVRSTSNPRDEILAANLSYDEATLYNANRALNFYSNGFEPVYSGTASAENNALGETYIYLAIA